MAAGHEDLRLENLPVVITVPASFDEVAGICTVAAAKQAGLQNVLLLEEPQAAFYCWLGTYPPDENNVLQPGSRALVVDIGGGTSDFSLICAVEEQGELAFVREAVGDHLLLGGDNMDLALAKIVEGNLKGASRLDAAQYGMLDAGLPRRQGKVAREKSAGFLHRYGHGPRPPGDRRIFTRYLNARRHSPGHLRRLFPARIR